MRTLKRITALLIASAAIFVIAVCIMPELTAEQASAKDTVFRGTATFTGSKMKSTFNSRNFAKALTDMQPGDSISVTVKYENKSGKKTDWYMANEVLKTLEKANKSKNVPEGTGDPENGGYGYELRLTDQKGEETVLYTNRKVGGDAKTEDLVGLEQATNALRDWFYLNSLDKNENSSVTLDINLDGETEVNDYMGTEGEVAIRFATDYTREPNEKSPEPDDDDEDDDAPEYRQPKTGDFTRLIPYVIMLAAGIALLIAVLAIRKRREETK